MSKTVHLQVKEAKGLIQKGIGLINKPPEPLLLRTRFGIHTFGMQYPIDVIILDAKNKVVKKKERLLPNRIFVWSPRYNTVIELPGDSIKKYNISVSDILQFST
jgi:uncharacterized membrane protein (UPF0127 family)